MLKIVAIGVTPRIHEFERDRIQEFLDGIHPMSPARKTYDTGTKKKTVLDQSPMGPNDIPEEQDDRTSHSGIGSGYNQGLNPGGKADEESGPGYTPDSDAEQDLETGDTAELMFKNDNDLSSKFSPLNLDSRQRDKNTTKFLMDLHRRPGIGRLPTRTPVDDLVKSRTVSSGWKRLFSV